MVNTNSAVPVSNSASVVTTGLENDWQGLVAAGLIFVAGGYILYKLMKW